MNPRPDILEMLARGIVPRVEVYPSIITGQTTGAQDHGPASQMSYKVWINAPDGPKEVVGMPSVMERWYDGIDCIPLQTGRTVLVGNVCGALQLMAREIPFVEPCSGPAPGGMSLLQQFVALDANEKAAFVAELRKVGF